MAILHIVQYSLPQIQSGYTLRTQAILREQRRLGLGPLVVTSSRHPSATDEDVEGVPHYRCRVELRSASVWLRDRARVQRLAERIEQLVRSRGDVRLLHAHSPVLCGLAALRAGRRLRLPVVHEVRGLWEEAMRRRGLAWRPRYHLARLVEARVARRADAVVAISEGLREEFVSRGVPAERIHVVRNGVDTEAFRPRAAGPAWRAEHGLAEGPLLLYLGALRQYEGTELLVTAFAEIARRHPGAQLLIVGDGEARGEVMARAAGQPAISLWPPVAHEEVGDLYAAADVVVYPRRSDRATERVTPLKPLEAMAMGRAIVASGVGGLRELLTDSETARLFAAGSVAALTEACAALLADGDERRRLGERAREVAVARYDWREIAAEYCDVYRGVGVMDIPSREECSRLR